MMVYAILKECYNWKANGRNYSEIIEIYDELNKAENRLNRIYQEEINYLKDRNLKLIKDIKRVHSFEIRSTFEDINIFITKKEVI